MELRKRNKLIYGVGVNDSKTVIRPIVNGKQIRCPFYGKWLSMLSRCYDSKYHAHRSTYMGCSVVKEWIYFTNFKAWMETQDWQGKQLDKDILVPGNKIYSPETCVFIDQKVNKFIIESSATRGQWPIGVTFHKASNKYMVLCRDAVTGKNKYLGLFEDPEEAHEAWLTFKLEQAYILAAEQTDERVAKALIERYENYTVEPQPAD